MTAGHETVPIYPRLLDCFPSLKSFPGCKVPLTETPAYFRTTYMRRTTPSPVAPSRASVPANRTADNSDEESDGGNDEAIALPSTCMGSAGTRQDELPTIPPPSQYWKLKKLDHSANVMDYWIKSCQQWDIEGIESDILVVMGGAAV